MGTLLRLAGWRVMIYTLDHPPPHVHVVGPGGRAKIALNCAGGMPLPISAFGIRPDVLKELTRTIAANQTMLCEAWRRTHGTA
ncbi:DUF4160 domain-containing protein [Sulfuricystis thermophila]|uniref:DUF4160 domain-containing protein n=1 Tax=Sulfuricystis thermophila TaxID=2496847 RepID=UPI001035C51C|nr:DUF4160 domain-containing protein [Sulfuricystis thermophila]